MASPRSLLALLVVVCVAATGAGCGDTGRAGGRIVLVPSTDAAADSWDWTPECRTGPVATVGSGGGNAGCDASGPVLGSAQLAGNAWNLGTAAAGGIERTGSLRMSTTDDGALSVDANIRSAPPCTAASCIAPEGNTWVRGFPSVLYGIDQCNAGTSPPHSTDLKLPMKVGAVPTGLIGSTTYDVRGSAVTYDVAYDLWLNPTDTTTPCKTDGTLEVMVWTGYDSPAVLPDSMGIGRATIPFAVDGVAGPDRDAWTVFASNIFDGGHTQPWGGTIWLVLDPDHAVDKGTVTVDLDGALDEVGRIVQDTYRWTNFADTYWLDTIAFGIEFGPESADPFGDGSAEFALDLTSYCLAMGATVSTAEC